MGLIEVLQMECLRVIRNEEYLPCASVVLAQARKAIDLCTYKFELSNRTDAKRFMLRVLTLYELAIKGVRIRVLLNTTKSRSGLTKINEYAARELKKHKIEVRTLKDNRCQHSKMLLVDGQWAIIGSHNWTPRSMTDNFEVSVVLYGQNHIQEIQQHFDNIWNKSKIL